MRGYLEKFRYINITEYNTAIKTEVGTERGNV